MNKRLTKNTICLMLLALCLLLAACGKGGASAPSRATAVPTPAPTPEPVRFAGGEVAPTVTELRMPLAAGETALLDSLPALRAADLSGSADENEVAAWALAHPGVQTQYTVTLPNGIALLSDTRSVDLSGLSAAECEAAARKLALLPALESVSLGAEGGPLNWGDIARLREILPRPVFHYAFKLYGTDCNLDNTTINLYKVAVNDNGRFIDEVMRYMPQLTYVDMDSTGLDPKRLEEINLNHPDAKVVFRVFFGDNYTARTDTERILASMASRGGMLNNDNVSGLYYCHDVKYLDLGHNTWLTNIGFVAQMPKLEVAILSMCNIRDASPLASCPELEYLEMSNTYCDDLRPLSGLSKLRHLNIAGIGYDFYGDGTRPSLKDITPLYPLTGLERLWIGAYNPVPPEQVAEMQRRAPGCEIDLTVYDDPVGGRWRYIALADYINTYVDTYHERYVKLRQQFGDYDYSVYNFTWNDPLFDEAYRYTPQATPSPSPTPAAAPVPTATPAPVYQPDYQQQPQVYQPYYEEEYTPYQEEYEEPEPEPPYAQETPNVDLVFNYGTQPAIQSQTEQYDQNQSLPADTPSQELPPMDLGGYDDSSQLQGEAYIP